MFGHLQKYICSWGWYEAVHFWIEIGQLVTFLILFVLVIRMWRRMK